MKRIGKYVFIFTLIASTANAAIQAFVDRSQITQEESVSLKISISGESGKEINPKFEANDFEIMNQFENSQFSSVYVNGKFENKSERSVTYILRPLKVGSLKIQNITNAGEKAADISIQVSRDTGMNKRALPGEAPSRKGDAKNFFVKAEINKSRAYKGEQLLVSFYIYRRTRVNLRDVMQYPSFQGFIREDLEMPILSGHPDYEAVSLGGIPFERALLARYAIYPIKEGKLKIDGFSIRADYIPKNNANEDMMEDPFFQFFSQVTPRTGVAKSDPLTIEVLPLPEEGKTSLYSGGVGDFEVSSQLDSNTIKAHSPLTLHVTVKGKGNASLIEFPKVAWPEEVKFYESQGKSKNLGQGNTEKTFDVVLVPQKKGTFEIPPIEFEFYNPESKAYVRKKTTAIPIVVSEGDPNSASVITDKGVDEHSANGAPKEVQEAHGWGALKLKEENKNESPSSFMGQPWWRWVSWGGFLVLFAFFGLVIFDQARKRSLVQLDLIKRKQSAESFWHKLEKEAQTLTQSQASAHQFSVIYEEIMDQLYQTLDDAFGITSRAMPSRDLAKVLTEHHGVSEEQWRKVSQIIEYSEAIRFASNAGAMNDSEVQTKTQQSIETAKKLCADFSSKKLNN